MAGEIQLTVLGSGTSQGVPMIGCRCTVCRSPDPRDQRTRASIYLRTPETALLVDTTPDLRQQALREGLERVDAVLLTHAHADHLMGFDDLRRFCDLKGTALPVYGAEATLAEARRIFYWAFSGSAQPGYLRAQAHVVQGPFHFGALQVTPLPVPHGEAVTWGYLFSWQGEKRLAYFCDAKEIPPGVRALIAGVPVLILDGLRDEPHPTHLSIPEAVATARAVGAGQTFLTHLTHQQTHARREADLSPQGIGVAFDGMKLEV